MRSQARRTRPHRDASVSPLQPLEPRLLMSTAPVATDDAVSTASGSPVVINILANDFDPDGEPIDPASITVVSGAGFGVVEIDYDAGTLTYTPDAGFIGTELLSYVISDAEGNVSNEAIVTIDVALPPAPPPPEPMGENVTFVAASGFMPSHLVLKRSGDALQIIDQFSRKVLFTQALDSLNSLTIDAGAAKGAVHVKLDLSGGSFDLAGGLKLIGGSSRCPDTLVIRAMGGGDQVTINGEQVSVNGLDIELSQFEKLKVRTASGVMMVKLAEAPAPVKKGCKPMKACDPVMSFKFKHVQGIKHLLRR